MVTKTYIQSLNAQLEVLFTNEMGEKEILFVPGMGGDASCFSRDMNEFSHEFCVSFTPRGREGSSAPESGYSFENHAQDIVNLCKEIGMIRPIVVANSQGVLWALKAIDSGLQARAFVAIDHGPVMNELNDDWFEKASHKYSPFSSVALKGLRNEYLPKDLSQLWRELTCPFFLLHGQKQGSAVTDEHVDFFQKNVQLPKIIKLSNSGHGLANEDESLLWDLIRQIS